MDLNQVTKWIAEYKEIVIHVAGYVITGVVGVVIAVIVRWYRTAKYGKLVRVEVARLEEGKTLTFISRPLIVKPALEFLHRRTLASKLVSAFNRAEDGQWIRDDQWKLKDAHHVLNAAALEIQESFAHGTIGWAVGDKDVTIAEFVLVAYRQGKDVLMQLFRPEDLKQLLLQKKRMSGNQLYTLAYALQVGDAFLINPHKHALTQLSLCM